MSVRLAELHAMGTLLERAAEVVESGWVQDAWFTVATRRGQRNVTAFGLRLAENRPVVGACLVGAVVQAGGGPSAANTQLVRRTLDLTWHTLHRGPDERVEWCPGPSVRMLHVLDLTRWNDAPRRNSGRSSVCWQQHDVKPRQNGAGTSPTGRSWQGSHHRASSPSAS